MIQDVDETLRTLMQEALGPIVQSALGARPLVTFARPTQAEAPPADAPRVNLYLHDVRENRALRDETFHFNQRPGQSTAGRKRAPVRLDLAYLVTAHAPGGAEHEHQLLSEALGVLLRHPAVPREYLVGRCALQETPLSLLVAQSDHPSHLDPPALWRALDAPLRPTLSLVVTASFDPFAEEALPIVREAFLGLGQGPAAINGASGATTSLGTRASRELLDVRVSLAGYVAVRGAVGRGKDGAPGPPLENARVGIAGRLETAVTDAEGFFYFLNLPPGPYTLQVTHPGRAPAEVAAVVPPHGRGDLLATLDIRMDPLDASADASEAGAPPDMPEEPAGGEVREVWEAGAERARAGGRLVHAALAGRLVFEDGTPAAYVPVRVGDHRTVTDANGLYLLCGVAEAAAVVVAELAGRGEMEVAPSEADGAAVLAGRPGDA